MAINPKNVQVTSYSLHTDGRASTSAKTMQVVAPRGTFKRGERIPKLSLQDTKGDKVALELAHVVQQKAGVGRTASGEPAEEVTISFHALTRDH